MKYVWMVVIGIIIGMIARFVYPGAVHMGWIESGLLGIGGSFVGGIIGGMFTKEKDMMSLKPAGFLMSVVGALVLIFIFRSVLHLV